MLAKEKGLDPDMVAARLASPGGRKGFGGGDRGSRSSGGSSGGGAARRAQGGGAGDRGFNNTIVDRTLYKLVDLEDDARRLEAEMQALAKQPPTDGKKPPNP